MPQRLTLTAVSVSRVILHPPGTDPLLDAVTFFPGNEVVFHNIGLYLRGKYNLDIHEKASIDGQFARFTNGKSVPLRELAGLEIGVEVKLNNSGTKKRALSFNDFALF